MSPPNYVDLRCEEVIVKLFFFAVKKRQSRPNTSNSSETHREAWGSLEKSEHRS